MGFARKNIIGVDIGSYQIKLIEMDRWGMPSKGALVPIPKELEGSQAALPEDYLAQEIKVAMEKNKIKGKRCSLCLSSQHIISKVVLLPSMGEELMKENIYYDIEGYLPLELDDYMIDYVTMKTSMRNGTEYRHILATAVLKKVVFSHINVLRKAGIKPIYVDIPSNCIQKLLINLSPLDRQPALREGNLCLIDSGAHYTNITILNKGNYFVDKTIPLGSETISSKAGNYQEAKIYYQKVVEEAMEVIRYFIIHTPDHKILDNLILLGGGAMLQGFSKYLKDGTGIDVTLFSHWMKPSFDNLGKEELLLMGNAIGSTIRRDPS